MLIFQYKEGVRIINDTFANTNGTLIENHSPEIGGSWVRNIFQDAPIIPGSVEIQNNQLVIEDDTQCATIDCGVTDHQIIVEWTLAPVSLNRNGIIMRYVDSLNHLYLNIREDNGDVQFIEWDNGVADIPANAPYTWVEGQTYTIKVVSVGNNHEAFINNASVLTATSSVASTGTHVGIGRNAGSTGTIFDNFRVI